MTPATIPGERLEVLRLGPAMRALTVLVCGAAGACCVGLGFRFASAGHEVGFVLGGLCAWAALFWLLVPAAKVTVRGNGFSYIDPRFGWMLRFPPGHAAWTDVVAVDTREVSSRSGSYLRSRVTVRSGAGPGTRAFTVSSRDRGYARFLDLLAAQTAGQPIEASGLGVEAIGVRRALHNIRAGQLRVVAGFALLAGAMVLVAYLTRR